MNTRGHLRARVKMKCDFCGRELVDPLEEPFNLHFIDHLKETPACMELFAYGVVNLRNEIGVRYGKRPQVEGL